MSRKSIDILPQFLFGLTLDDRQAGAEEIVGAAPSIRRKMMSPRRAVYEVLAPYDPARLSSRAWRLLSLIQTTFDDGDDLSPRLVVRRRVGPIEEAARTPQQVEEAARWRRIYGTACDGESEGVVPAPPRAAPLSAVADCTDYLNDLAETAGLAVQTADKRVHPLGSEPPLERTESAWRWMLRQQ